MSLVVKRRTGDTDNAVVYGWLRDIYEPVYEGSNQFIQRMREWLVYRPTETNIAKHASHFIKIYYTILKEYEKYPETKGIRRFSLLPHKHGFTQSHITICNTSLETTLKYIAKKIKVANGTVDPALELTDFSNNRDEYWRKLFNVGKYETTQKKFGHAILTDGKSIVVRMRKPKSTTEPSCCTKKAKKGEND